MATFAQLDELTLRTGDHASTGIRRRFEFDGRRISPIQRMRDTTFVAGLDGTISILARIACCRIAPRGSADLTI
ncbi:MAG: hypothetical protein M3P18_16800 [Actinomycetota bacterium]|nr:hypothetical protein [Actinomycetota bacterium]